MLTAYIKDALTARKGGPITAELSNRKDRIETAFGGDDPGVFRSWERKARRQPRQKGRRRETGTGDAALDGIGIPAALRGAIHKTRVRPIRPQK